MNIGLLLPGFSSHKDDWAIPAQQNLARLLADRDNLRIIALRYPHRRDCYTIDGAAVYSLGAGQVRGSGRLALWWRALRLIETLHHQQPFEVFHAMWADETGLIAAWVGRRLGVPVVVSILGGELVGFPDIGYGLQRSRFSRWIVRQALSGVDRVIVPSSYVQHLIPQAGYHISDENIVTITLGVDAERFTPTTAPPSPNHLIHVASLVPVKDQIVLLRALALLNTSVTLDIIGEGTERAHLEALAQELGIDNHVRFLGAVAHTQLPDHYRRATLHVMSSRHETIALTVLEAAACGVPTISTNVGVLADYPALGVTVPVADAPALAQAIRSLLDDTQRHTALSRSARVCVEEALSIQRTAEALRALYSQLSGKDGS